MMPADDQRYLAGEVHDEAVRLSRFDGGAVLLYEAQLNAQGELVGDFWSDRGGHQRFTARRNPDASIDAAAIATQLRDPAAGFEFSFRDPAGQGRLVARRTVRRQGPAGHPGRQLVSQQPRRGRPAGRRWTASTARRGLEIVALMFEQHRDFARSAAAVQRFRAAHRIEYPTLIAGPMDKASAAQALPQLDGIRAYPTLVFIDRAGQRSQDPHRFRRPGDRRRARGAGPRDRAR